MSFLQVSPSQASGILSKTTSQAQKDLNSLIYNSFIAHKMADKVPHIVIHGRTYYMNFRLNDSTSFVQQRSGMDNLKQTQRIGSLVQMGPSDFVML
ncbi:hypothetical protein C6560_06335 [Enterobacter sp. FS01]|nr:hypothetical protein C6560_06335 [Enterobacter sp. FS01]